MSPAAPGASAPRLGEGQRTQLSSIVTAIHTTLDRDLSQLLEGRYGIRADGTSEPETSLRLDPDQQALRADLLDVLAHLAREGDRGSAGVTRLRREAVFTHANRLIAIRIAEALGFLPESIAMGRTSTGFRDLLSDAAPLLANDEHGGYWTYLSLCGDELAADMPRLFDPRNPLLALVPSPRALDAVIGHLAPDLDDPASGLASIWVAADTLGWAYQFFNQRIERDAMRKAPAPRSSRELAVRNQFFTPEYVVSYLVENTLGRLLATDPTGPLVDQLPWLTDLPAGTAAAPDLRSVQVLDPACGSGHFLLGAYDVLERAWLAQGVAPEEAAPSIVSALWGIDIDARAAQVAAAAINLRARRSCGPMVPLPEPNTICARNVPPVPADLQADLGSDARALLAELSTVMNDPAKGVEVLGSLLEVEVHLGFDIEGAPGVANQLGAAGRMTTGEVEEAITQIEGAVQQAADQAGSTPAERLTAAETGDSLRFVQAMRQRYDVVLMNPPFGEPVPSTKPYLKRTYPWIPTKDHNLLAAFVGRGARLCKPGGMVGAITSRAGLFLTTFEAWRRDVLFANRLVGLADLGYPVMEQAMVEAAAYILATGKPTDRGRPATCLRLLREAKDDKPTALVALAAMARTGVADPRIFHVVAEDLTDLPGEPLAYWVPASVRQLFRTRPRLEGHGAEIRQGLATGDDFRFLRAAWEVDPSKIATSREETRHGRRWVPFAKGGEYAPFWSDVHLVVDYGHDGQHLRDFPGSVIRNKQYYFRPGLTWPRRTQSGFNPSVLPGGTAFADKGPAIFVTRDIDPMALLAILMSRPVIAILSSIATFGSYEVGLVANLPLGDSAGNLPRSAAEIGREVAEFRRTLTTFDETSRLFCQIGCSSSIADVLAMDRDHLSQAAFLYMAWAEHEPAVLKALDLDPDIERWLDREVGSLSTASGENEGRSPRWVDSELEGSARFWRTSIKSGADRLTSDAKRMISLKNDFSQRCTSYLVGCAVGRWDVRIGRDPSLAPPLGDLFDPLPVCPPGMLVGADGLPERGQPHGYPLSLPSPRLLVDQAGHPNDIVAAMRAAAAALVDDPDALVDEMQGLLGRDLREHLRRGFWKDHLGRYTKSRRKAPIYWPLTTPSRSWTVWVYAPALDREVLYAVEAAADQRLGLSVAEVRRLEAQQLQAGGRTTRELAQHLEDERKVLGELRAFQAEARRIAEIGWDPDLDDGIVLNAAPLAELFPDWRAELADQRRKLAAGEHDGWAHIARWKAAL